MAYDAGPAGPDDARGGLVMRALVDYRDGELVHRALPDIRARSDATIELQGGPSSRDSIIRFGGSPESVAKAAGLCVRVIQNEPLDGPSAADARAMVLRFLAFLNATQHVLEGTSDRVLSIEGVADAIHIATFYSGKAVLAHSTRFGGADRDFDRRGPPAPSPSRGYAGDASGYGRPPPDGYGYRNGSGSSAYAGGDRYDSRAPPPYDGRGRYDDRSIPGRGGYRPRSRSPPRRAPPPMRSGSQSVHRMFVPDSVVRGLIGAAGRNIRDIRSRSRCDVQITESKSEAKDGSGLERLVEIEGTPEDVKGAVDMIQQQVNRLWAPPARSDRQSTREREASPVRRRTPPPPPTEEKPRVEAATEAAVEAKPPVLDPAVEGMAEAKPVTTDPAVEGMAEARPPAEDPVAGSTAPAVDDAADAPAAPQLDPAVDGMADARPEPALDPAVDGMADAKPADADADA